MAIMYKSVKGASAVQPTGNAQPADVLSGKTFSNADGTNKTGTMPNNGAVSGTATPSQPYTIPVGYHNGSGTVTAQSSAIRVGTFTVESDGSGRHAHITLSDLSIGETIHIMNIGMGGSWTNTGAVGANNVQLIGTNNDPTYRYYTAVATATSATLDFTTTAGYTANFGYVFY